MNLQKELDYKGLQLVLLQADIDEDDFPRQRFRAILRIKNTSENKKMVAIKQDGTKYISKEYGIEYSYLIKPYQFALSNGTYINPESFVDVIIQFDVVKEANNEDRMEIELKDLAHLPLVRCDNQWYWCIDEIEYIRTESGLSREEKKLLKKQLKSKIEHFESIDEKFGLSLQNFSFEIVDWNTLQLFCEVLGINGGNSEDGFNIEVAIYDLDNDIVCLKSISKYNDDFKGFEVFGFGPIKLDIPLDEISKIRIYPTR